MAKIAKHPVSDGEREWVCDIYVIKEKLSFLIGVWISISIYCYYEDYYL